MSNTTQDYVATGGNRHPSAADWHSDLLGYGAGNNVALWNPDSPQHHGVHTVLKGHVGTVNAVRILNTASYGQIIISGSSDHCIRLWRKQDGRFVQWLVVDAHEASINTISVLQQTNTFVTGGADATVRLWQIDSEQVQLIQTIQLRPKYLVLATALTALNGSCQILAVAGTANTIQIYTRHETDQFNLQATLSGHEGWIRSLDFAQDFGNGSHDVLLSSGSQDKYIRLWRIRQSEESLDGRSGGLLTNKVYPLRCGDMEWTMWYDALLVGHEDWIYTVRWKSTNASPTLLSASADNSLSIWTKETSGLWLCTTRLGEISSQKGSTTATGSTGGFWIGLWSPNSQSVVSLGKTGSWRRWLFDTNQGTWQQSIGVGGHTKEVQQLSWSPYGAYLLSTSADQTTRLYSQWCRENIESWHEIGRPQIHGYDLNCVAAVTADSFVSAAEEKLLRVFSKPRQAESLLSSLNGSSAKKMESFPSTAAMPVLGLSNKVIEAAPEDSEVESGLTLNLHEPPNEDFLSRQSLWPEHEKLYGHGYEISALAVSPSAAVIATACKASTIDHAVIRLFETSTWREVKPPLTAHTLTITSLAFSLDDRYLLSVGRDRQLAVFRQNGSDYALFHTNQRAHSRMILDCSWLANEHVFATAGRDKLVKIWRIDHDSIDQIASINTTMAVTAVAFSLMDQRLLFGTENGSLIMTDGGDGWQQMTSISDEYCPAKAVTSIVWRPGSNHEVAVASEDTTIRILKIV